MTVTTRPAEGPSRIDSQRPTEGIAFDRVRKVYVDRRSISTALDDVSFIVPSRMFKTIIGPSGCGKSTLLTMAAGLVRPDGGVVKVFGQDPHAACDAKEIALVPQRPCN